MRDGKITTIDYASPAYASLNWTWCVTRFNACNRSREQPRSWSHSCHRSSHV